MGSRVAAASDEGEIYKEEEEKERYTATEK